ncbi:MAG: GNAT family N-acetyltransferase [Anaerolinea sp.]|nr:GNAT family N-acetyltransferase [Anaerolinea sp.]
MDHPPGVGHHHHHHGHAQTHHHQHHIPHVTITHTRREHAEALAAAQRLAFPTLVDDELLSAEKYRKHIELFPEGQIVALVRENGREIPVGSTSTFRTSFDFIAHKHTFMEAIADGWLTKHDPHGEWLYGADISIHPKYRGLKIARKLYDARKELVRRLNLRGEIAGGLFPGYEQYKQEMTIAQYILQVHQGKLFDPTLTVQMRNGFRVRGILYDHISDSRSNNAAALIVRENGSYHPR